jgi:predicted HAD superfamily hydrolase
MVKISLHFDIRIKTDYQYFNRITHHSSFITKTKIHEILLSISVLNQPVFIFL